MFANLKNKFIEEVKASPSKFQQLANAAQAAVSSSTNTTSNGSDSATSTVTGNKSFFSITEDDTPDSTPVRFTKSTLTSGTMKSKNNVIQQQQSSLNNNTGGIARTRKLSNSSMASDMSFRLPYYETGSIYHLQSDVDESGSEIGDTTSTSAKLDVITKEQLYKAYRKSLDRYQKYRFRYIDLANKYKELEENSTKARSVLMETQEKAVRHIHELREQCTLEQQAKAHLEEALRVEIDEMQCKMQAYQTKLKLLGENPEGIAAALDAASSGSESKNILINNNDTVNNIQSNNNNDVIENKNNDEGKIDGDNKDNDINELRRQLDEKQKQIIELNEKLDIMRKQEEENVLLFAQTKAAIHSELESKENEVKNLTKNLKDTQNELQMTIKKFEQNKIKNDEYNDMKEKFKQCQQNKQEMEAKMIASEHLLCEIKDKLLNKEKMIRNLQETLDNMKKKKVENENQLKEQAELRLTEMNKELLEHKNEIDNIRKSLKDKDIEIEQIKKGHEEVLGNLSKQLNNKIIELEQEVLIIKESKENESNNHEQIVKDYEERLAIKERELMNVNSEKIKNEEQYEKQYTTIQEQFNEIEKLQKSLQQQEDLLEHMREESTLRDEMADKEKNDLKDQINNILKQIGQMEEQMHTVQLSHYRLELEKAALEKRYEEQQQFQLAQQQQHDNENDIPWQELLNETEKKLHDAEAKLQNIESENQQLAEKNCLVEESIYRLQKMLADKQAEQQIAKDDLINELQLKLETNETSMQKLSEKMSAILDDNSRLHNNQELHDHDYRTLQDKYDSLEKEKHNLNDDKKCLEEELLNIKLQLSTEMDKCKQLKEIDDSKNLKIGQLKEHNDILENNLTEIKGLIKEKELILTEVKHKMEDLKNDYDNKIKMCQKLENDNEQLKEKLGDLDEKELTLIRLQDDYHKLENEKLNLMEQLKQQETQMNDMLKKQKDMENMDAEKSIRMTERDKQIEMLRNQLEEYDKKYENVDQIYAKCDKLQMECDYLNTHAEELERELEKLNENKESESNIELKNKFESLQCELYALKSQVKEYEKMQLGKEKCLLESQMQIQKLMKKINDTNSELQQCTEDFKCIKEQNDEIKNDLNITRQNLDQSEISHIKIKKELEDLQLKAKAQEKHYKQEINDMQTKLDNAIKEKDDVLQQLMQLRDKLEQKEIIKDNIRKFKQAFNEFSKRDLNNSIMNFTHSSESCSPNNNRSAILVSQEQAENLREINATLQNELEELKQKSNTELINLQQEIDDLRNLNKQLSERNMDIEYLRAGLKTQTAYDLDRKQDDTMGAMSLAPTKDDSLPEDKELDDKLKEIMAEVQDVSNRNLFLEQKCENYLILEQSNERLRIQNSKLSRQLDETLVSLQHSDVAATNTEFEYLRNIMFQYLTGTSNGNNETLVKVISAVLKFSPQQTQVALEKEHQRRSLLNKIL